MGDIYLPGKIYFRTTKHHLVVLEYLVGVLRDILHSLIGYGLLNICRVKDDPEALCVCFIFCWLVGFASAFLF